MIRLVAVFAVVAAVAGCDKKKESGGGGGGEAAKAVKLPNLGLQIDAPGAVELHDSIGNKGHGHMLSVGGVGGMAIDEDSKPMTLDEAKADQDMYTPKNLKTETLPDGWVLTFNNEGSMGTNYFTVVRRDIDGKSYKCSATSPNDNFAGAIAVCKSLRK